MSTDQYKHSIFSPLFTSLFQRFMGSSRYELYRVITIEGEGGTKKSVRRRVDTPAAFGVFLEAFFIFFVAVVAASRRVFVFHTLEFFFAESRRRPGHYVLRLKPHVKIGKYFEEHPSLMKRKVSYGEEDLYDSAVRIYNGLLEVAKRRDTIVSTDTETEVS